MTSSGVKAVDEFWRELVESRNAMAEFKKGGLTEKDIRDQLTGVEQLNSRGISRIRPFATRTLSRASKKSCLPPASLPPRRK